MLYNAENKIIEINGVITDYIRFGKGKRTLIMLPGVGDGFKTAKGMALPFAFMYRMFVKDFTVYLFSRRRDIPEGFTIEDMADDISDIMDKLRIEKADVFGASQGGMIALALALRHPEKVNKLIPAVTCPGPNEILEDSIRGWLKMAENRDYEGIMLDTVKRSYTGSYLKQSEASYKLLSKFTKPKDFTRFRILCESCLKFDVRDKLSEITSPTYIIGADEDKALGIEGSKELKEKIKNAELYVYEGYSHGVYEQAKDFNERVLEYLNK